MIGYKCILIQRSYSTQADLNWKLKLLKHRAHIAQKKSAKGRIATTDLQTAAYISNEAYGLVIDNVNIQFRTIEYLKQQSR